MRFAPEVHATGRGFRVNFDPSRFEHQFLDSSAFVEQFADRVYHVHIKDSRRRSTAGVRSSGAPGLR